MSGVVFSFLLKNMIHISFVPKRSERCFFVIKAKKDFKDCLLHVFRHVRGGQQCRYNLAYVCVM